MASSYHVGDLQVIGSELAIRWSDGSESYVPLETLRRRCPCALCAGEPDLLGRVAPPKVSYQPNSFELTSLNQVGGYAIQPTWADGHATGIYPFPYLRRLAEETEAQSCG